MEKIHCKMLTKVTSLRKHDKVNVSSSQLDITSTNEETVNVVVCMKNTRCVSVRELLIEEQKQFSRPICNALFLSEITD